TTHSNSSHRKHIARQFIPTRRSSDLLLNKLSDLNQKKQATIVMVTHDPTAASYSSRVIFIQDGHIYTHLNKGEETRKDFFQDIIKTQGVLGGVQYEY